MELTTTVLLVHQIWFWLNYKKSQAIISYDVIKVRYMPFAESKT